MHSGWYCNRRPHLYQGYSLLTLIVRVTGVSCFDFVETVSLLSESEDESELSLEDSAVCLAPSANEESFFSLSEERAEPVVFSSVALFIFEEFTLFVFPAHPRTIRSSTTSSRTPPAVIQICRIFSGAGGNIWIFV